MTQEFTLGPLQTALIADLRSGQYKQTTGRLYQMVGKQEAFCLMGVALEGMRRRHVFGNRLKKVVDWVAGNDGYYKYSGFALLDSVKDEIDADRLRNNLPPQEVWEALGFMTEMGHVIPGHGAVLPAINNNSSLVGANDGGVSFEQLANVLETYPEAFFTGPK